MTGPSFERIDYQLRYNKHIERRLIFDLLSRAQQSVGFADHGYLGFGSMWFADFRLAHRVLELESMLSMEREEHADRARFNQPYSSITVMGGDSSETLAKLGNAYWARPHLAWLDYDGRLSQDVVKDLYFFLESCATESVVIVTLNGGWRNYRPGLVKQGQVRGRKQTAVGQIEDLLGANVVSPEFEPGPVNAVGASPDISEDRFAEFFAEALLTALAHRVAASGRVVGGEGLSFVPLFNFCHEDGVEMVTVGGAIVVGSREALWKDTVRKGVPLKGDLPAHQRLDLVPLTLKEKMALDACLPRPEPEFMETAKEFGLRLHEQELAKYWRYHRQFPVFFESPL